MNICRWSIGSGFAFVAMASLAWGLFQMNGEYPASRAQAHDGPVVRQVIIPVKTVHPQKGVLERLSTQPGTIQAYEIVRLYAKVPGFLKTQKVDIGDRVKKGEVLAVLDVPELQAQVERGNAVVDQARSHVTQMSARVVSAKADLDAAKASLVQANASAKSAAAWVRYRGLQLQRMKDLFTSRSIEERLVEEAKEHHEAAIETELSAREAITSNKAKVASAAAKIDQAEADVLVAQSEVRVAQADLTKATIQLSFSRITAPFDGVVTQRSFFPGDFVRSANEGGQHEPLLVVQRTDLMRVIVQIPDRDVPFLDIGDEATIEVDALPGRKWTGKIARFSPTEDAHTRLMHVEIDLPNPRGNIRHGMYGKVTIVLDRSTDQMSIPSACLVGKAGNGVGEVYVLRDHDHAHLTRVRLGIDNGLRVAVLSGLTPADEVIVQPNSGLMEGSLVTHGVVPAEPDEDGDTDH
jgi:HlyD family secretion protein